MATEEAIQSYRRRQEEIKIDGISLWRRNISVVTKVVCTRLELPESAGDSGRSGLENHFWARG